MMSYWQILIQWLVFLYEERDTDGHVVMETEIAVTFAATVYGMGLALQGLPATTRN
jgi:hypothetical protein